MVAYAGAAEGCFGILSSDPSMLCADVAAYVPAELLRCA